MNFRGKVRLSSATLATVRSGSLVIMRRGDTRRTDTAQLASSYDGDLAAILAVGGLWIVGGRYRTTPALPTDQTLGVSVAAEPLDEVAMAERLRVGDQLESELDWAAANQLLRIGNQTAPAVLYPNQVEVDDNVANVAVIGPMYLAITSGTGSGQVAAMVERNPAGASSGTKSHAFEGTTNLFSPAPAAALTGDSRGRGIPMSSGSRVFGVTTNGQNVQFVAPAGGAEPKLTVRQVISTRVQLNNGQELLLDESYFNGTFVIRNIDFTNAKAFVRFEI